MTSTTPAVPQAKTLQWKTSASCQASAVPRMKGRTPTGWEGEREGVGEDMREWRSLWTELGTEMSFFVVLEASVALLWRYNVLVLVIAAAICAVALARWHSRLDTCFFFTIPMPG